MLVEIYTQSESGDYDLLELFGDENINIKFILKDSSDLSKIYSSYSQTFTIPGYGRNREILRYYFDTQVTRTSRRYLKSKIYVNKELFKVGLISINEGKMKMGRSSSYVINFFTSLTNLKELFGDETLSQTLKDIPYNIEWSDGRAYLYSQNKVTAPTFDPDVIVPLVSNKRVWTYESGSGGVNNIRYTGTDTGVKHIESNELKPAIPFSRIMNDIATSKGLIFNSPLFGQDEYEKLYVWCNGSSNSIKIKNLTYDSMWDNNSPDFTITSISGSDIFNIKYNASGNPTVRLYFDIQPRINGILLNSDSIIKYEYINADTGDIILTNKLQFFEGTPSFFSSLNRSLIFTPSNFPILSTTGLNLKIRLTFNDEYVYWQSDIEEYNQIVLASFSTGLKLSTNTLNSVTNINLYNLLPNIKTTDFIASFVKMFNISIIEDQINSNVINFVPRNTFFSEIIDYTPYVDIDSYNIKPTSLYKNINFKHKTSKYKSNIDFKIGMVTREFGELKYTTDDISLKDEYKIETQFNIVPNRLITNTKIQTFYGFLNESEDSVDYGKLWKPNTEDFTIFYYNGSQQLKNINNNNISLNFKIVEGGATLIEDLNTYNKVSIVYNDDPLTYTNSLGYSVEVDVVDNFEFKKNLFSNYYSNEISRIYNQNSRLFEYNCILPTREINRFSLDKLIIIGDRKFSIEQADINITNGKTKLTLMNISPNVTPITYLTPPSIFTATLL